MRRQRMRLGCLVRCVLMLSVIGGCGKTPEKLYPVEGTVAVAGTLLESGTIQFEMTQPGASGKVYTATSQIQADGSYQLQTFGKLGAAAGEHRVWISPNFAAMPDKLGTDNVRASAIPKKYMVPTTTDLTYEVVEGANEIDILVPEK